MLERYAKLRVYARQIEAVEDSLPSTSEHKNLCALLVHLTKLDSVCKRLQSDTTSMGEVRLLFDSVLLDYPIMGEYLKTNSKIVHSPIFENGLVKVGAGEKLSAAETAALERFGGQQSTQRPSDTGRKRKQCEDNYAAQIIQQNGPKRRAGGAVLSALAAQVPPTSNACERLFSEAKYVLTPQRSSTLPAHFEVLAFLRANKDMWSVTSLL
ncbi:hypothetical protein F444_18620 [Phytophthora nicotianae P1976]|uniref:HAT C-terminal dimerisation domain-containing protein n=1 Tax=Phytophthora nicotianae P1976 TaxID=1317066 RepID=A0A080ZAT0_PHYNI|nr:hypothetical protein F444_18620 [Phytophthora nicotianae P1976]